MITTYYTDDITTMPTAAIWRASLNASPLLCVPVFLYFLFRKLLGWRFRARYGTSRPQELEHPRAADIPQEVHHAFARYIDAVLQAKYHFLFFIRTPYIGAREGYSAVYLDETGTVWITLVWIHLWTRSVDRARVVFGCHSKRPTGVRLHTGPIAEEHRIPQMIPPTDEMLYLPIYTVNEEVIAQHLRRIEREKDLIRFDAETLRREIIHAAQEIFDFQVGIGVLTELTPAEVNRLIPDKYGE
jgi:hypothetical protein